jgi:hypothetical protein
MTRKLITAFVGAAIVGSFMTATTIVAEEGSPSPRSPQAQHDMNSHDEMMNMMGKMNPVHMKQMTEMMETCNRMMHTQAAPEQTPDHQ